MSRFRPRGADPTRRRRRNLETNPDFLAMAEMLLSGDARVIDICREFDIYEKTAKRALEAAGLEQVSFAVGQKKAVWRPTPAWKGKAPVQPARPVARPIAKAPAPAPAAPSVPAGPPVPAAPLGADTVEAEFKRAERLLEAAANEIIRLRDRLAQVEAERDQYYQGHVSWQKEGERRRARETQLSQTLRERGNHLASLLPPPGRGE